MAGLDPATQRARVGGRKRVNGAQTRASWVAGSEAGHGEFELWYRAPRQLVRPLVLRVAVMALDPAPFDLVALRFDVEQPP